MGFEFSPNMHKLRLSDSASFSSLLTYAFRKDVLQKVNTTPHPPKYFHLLTTNGRLGNVWKHESEARASLLHNFEFSQTFTTVYMTLYKHRKIFLFRL